MEIGSAAQNVQGQQVQGQAAQGQGSAEQPSVARQADAAASARLRTVAAEGGKQAAAAPAEDEGRAPSAERRLQSALRALNLLDDPAGSGQSRMELAYNRDTGRVVARIMDKESGELVREIPSKELQRLFAQMRKYLGHVFDEKA